MYYINKIVGFLVSPIGGAIAGGVAEEFYGGFGDVSADKILKDYLTEDLYRILIK